MKKLMIAVTGLAMVATLGAAVPVTGITANAATKKTTATKNVAPSLKVNAMANYKFNPNKPGNFQWQSVDDGFLMVVD